MFSLYHSILLRSLSTRHMMFYVFDRVKLMQIKFRSLIRPNAFDSSRKIKCFHQSNERLNATLYFWFSFQNKNPSMLRKIVHNSKKNICPSTIVMASGPQISICKKSKILLVEEVFTGNESLFCLASGGI